MFLIAETYSNKSSSTVTKLYPCARSSSTIWLNDAPFWAGHSTEVHSLATEYGAEYFVYKPFSFEHLQAAIKAIL